MMPNGVKVRRMDGGLRYQAPSLKTLSSIRLDQTKRNPSPNLQLYQSIQKVLDKLVNMVEDKILGFDVTGTTKYSKLCSYCSLFKSNFWVIMLMKILVRGIQIHQTCPLQYILQYRRRDAPIENIAVARAQVMLLVNFLQPLIQV